MAAEVLPLILIALGVETLLAARGGGRVKYDWLGMLLCFLLTGAALCLYAAAWWFTGGEAGGVRARYTGLDLYQMQYTLFTGADSHTLSLKAGEAIRGRVDTYIGELEVEVSDGDGNTICEEFPMNGERLIEVPAAGEYTILVYGRRTSGSFSFTRVPAEEAPAEKTTPIPAEVPEGAA